MDHYSDDFSMVVPSEENDEGVENIQDHVLSPLSHWKRTSHPIVAVKSRSGLHPAGIPQCHSPHQLKQVFGAEVGHQAMDGIQRNLVIQQMNLDQQMEKLKQFKHGLPEEASPVRQNQPLHCLPAGIGQPPSPSHILATSDKKKQINLPRDTSKMRGMAQQRLSNSQFGFNFSQPSPPKDRDFDEPEIYLTTSQASFQKPFMDGPPEQEVGFLGNLKNKLLADQTPEESPNKFENFISSFWGSKDQQNPPPEEEKKEESFWQGFTRFIGRKAPENGSEGDAIEKEHEGINSPVLSSPKQKLQKTQLLRFSNLRSEPEDDSESNDPSPRVEIMHSPVVFPSMLKGKKPEVADTPETREFLEPKMPQLLRKIFREEKTRVEQIVFNQDKSRFALLKTIIVLETEVIFYELVDEVFVGDDKTAKALDQIKKKCEKYLVVNREEYPRGGKPSRPSEHASECITETIDLNKVYPPSSPLEEGFTLYDTSTFKPLLKFSAKDLEANGLAVVNRSLRGMAISKLSLLGQSLQFAVAFNDCKSQVEFYNMDKPFLDILRSQKMEALKMEEEVEELQAEMRHHHSSFVSDSSAKTVEMFKPSRQVAQRPQQLKISPAVMKKDRGGYRKKARRSPSPPENFTLFHGSSPKRTSKPTSVISNPLLKVNPVFAKCFEQDLEHIEYLTAELFAFVLPTKVYLCSLHYSLNLQRMPMPLYQASCSIGDESVSNTPSISSMSSPDFQTLYPSKVAYMSQKIIKIVNKTPAKTGKGLTSTFSASLFDEKLAKIAYLKKTQGGKEIVKVEDLYDSSLNFEIQPQWKVGYLKFTPSGEKLVLIEETGAYLFIYSTLKFKFNGRPLQQFCPAKGSLVLGQPLDIVDLNFKELVINELPTDDKMVFDASQTLIIATSLKGFVQIFRVLSDEEMEDQIASLRDSDTQYGKWIWQKIVKVIPSSIVMEGATVKVDLAATEISEFQKQQNTKFSGMTAHFITDLKEIQAQQDSSLLSQSYSNLEVSALLEQLATDKSSSPLRDCLTQGQNFFGFIQEQDCSMLLNLVLESGWQMKYSVSIEDIIKSAYSRHLAKIERLNKIRQKKMADRQSSQNESTILESTTTLIEEEPIQIINSVLPQLPRASLLSMMAPSIAMTGNRQSNRKGKAFSNFSLNEKFKSRRKKEDRSFFSSISQSLRRKLLSPFELQEEDPLIALSAPEIPAEQAARQKQNKNKRQKTEMYAQLVESFSRMKSGGQENPTVAKLKNYEAIEGQLRMKSKFVP